MVGTNKTRVRNPPPPLSVKRDPKWSLFFMNKNMKIPVVVVYKITYRKKDKYYLKVFENVLVDDIITPKKRKPLVPDESTIVEIGVGSSFEERYMKKYETQKISKIDSQKKQTLNELQSIVNKQRGR